MNENSLIIRKATKDDDLEKIATLLYYTDEYIYPYWFENLDKCKEELPPLLVQEKFFFYIDNIYVALHKEKQEIIGIICITDQSVDLDYDYTELKSRNERYCFTIVNYIEKLIKEVEESSFAYISNVCVDKDYRGMHVGNTLLNAVLKEYRKRFHQIALDVLSDNPSAIHMYKNLGFEQISDVFKGFNDPNKEKPDVFSMIADIRE